MSSFFFYERRLPVVTSESQFQSDDILSNEGNLLLFGRRGSSLLSPIRIH